MKVVITTDTYLKALPTQSDRLRDKDVPDQLISVKAGTALAIVDQFPYEGVPNSEADDHVLVQLDQPIAGHQCTRWFIYGPHAKVEGTEPKNDPQQDKPIPPLAPPQKPDFGPTISIPGISRPVGIYEPICFQPSQSHFTWAEFTKGGTRIPVDANVTQRIVKIGRYLDEVRTFFGNRPIHITSGYRDPVSNRQVGGARNSRHMYGDAVDFWVEGIGVVDVFYKLKGYHPKGGLAVGNGFVHLDLRPGAPARWAYPGGPRVSLW